MRQAVCGLAVVGEEQQSFRHAIEPSNGEKPHACVLHKLGGRRAAVRVAQRRNIAAGLVEKDVCMLLRQRKALAVQTHNVAFFCTRSERRGRTVDCNFPLPDVFFRLAAGTDARRGNIFLKSHFLSSFVFDTHVG